MCKCSFSTSERVSGGVGWGRDYVCMGVCWITLVQGSLICIYFSHTVVLLVKENDMGCRSKGGLQNLVPPRGLFSVVNSRSKGHLRKRLLVTH